ncbi:hypothetical protein BST81_05745 [Leptolyngbya sp. 'hensonii']|uniref:FxLYD domain-containing protein n=1 Tax=Leptolyngbya sp. 'hensonii' TaxID=1922337 RepID=UPI00094F6932|nr:FxLYD domain-containing protein [Leptolyngbya sp. 'hensonii']OLP19264.1 hypothetical protein BST81_05745 [Leptolyngbya sp. 'hensonii']
MLKPTIPVLIASLVGLSCCTTAALASISTPFGDYPDTTPQEAENLLCYMRLSNGTALNLSSLCGNQQLLTMPVQELPVSEVSPQNSAETQEPDVAVVQLGRSGNSIVGRVQNNTGRTAKSIIVNYQIVGADNKITTGFAIVQPVNLAPGQSGQFRGEGSSAGKVKITSVDWD